MCVALLPQDDDDDEEETACVVCNSSANERQILLCDKCNGGAWHTFMRAVALTVAKVAN